MPGTQENNAPSIFDAWSSSTRDMMNGYARLFTPEWLNQPILPGWSIGNTYIVSDDNSRDPGMERRIVAENSYGRQLGRIMDAMVVLVDQLPEKTRTADGPVKEFIELAEEIRQIKEKTRTNRVDSLKAGLEALRKQSPQEFERLMDDFRKSSSVAEGPLPTRRRS